MDLGIVNIYADTVTHRASLTDHAQMTRFATGSYTGNGSGIATITTTFIPNYVQIQDATNEFIAWTNNYAGVQITRSTGVVSGTQQRLGVPPFYGFYGPNTNAIAYAWFALG